ncbi:MAG: extracellular solute-binding protein [Pseudomonadota bacterium]
MPASAEDIEYAHGVSFPYELKYSSGFQHFAYVNPNAPKGGTLRLAAFGTYDSFNNFIHKGRPVAGMHLTAESNLLYDRLLTKSADEPTARYANLADGVAIGGDFEWVAFRLRDNAYWHDGQPVTVEDIVFSFETFKSVGSVILRGLLADVERIEVIGPQQVRYSMREGAIRNPNVVLVIADLPVLPRHYWVSRDPSLTTIEPPLGSGPYRIASHVLGRKVVYQRVENYWGRDLPVNRGRYNFDIISYEYFRDTNVAREAMKSGELDIWNESMAKAWAAEYDIPLVREGLMIKHLLPLARPSGMWWPIIFNLRVERFQDRRVRKALHLLFNDVWVNDVQSYGFYKRGRSVFQGSIMAHRGLPSSDELALLEPYRNVLPKEVFEREYAPLHPSNLNEVRPKMLEAIKLFAEAGWEITDDGQMLSATTGEQFRVDFVVVSKSLIRALTPLMDILNDLGIATTARAPEVSNWLYRMRTRNFSVGMHNFEPTHLPGLQLRNRFGSVSADQEFGLNWGGIKDPIVDALIEKVIGATNTTEFLAATRALDRVLLWQFYFIPRSSRPGFRLVYWDKFGIPEHDALQRPSHHDLWWFDRDKDASLDSRLAELQR